MKKSLLANIAARRFLLLVTKFLQIPRHGGGILAHSSLQILSKSSRFVGCHWATRIFSFLYRFSKRLWFGDWFRPLHYLIVLFLKPLLCCLSRILWDIVMQEHPSTCPGWGKEVFTQIFSVLSPLHLSLDLVELSCPLNRETAPKHNVWDCVQVSVLFFLLLNTSQVDAKKLNLVSSAYTTFSQSFTESSRPLFANFRWACTCAFLCREDLAGTTWFQSTMT